MNKYIPSEIEKKWQKVWEENNSFKIDKDDDSKEKYYILDMFPYPSGTGLHMGHTESYTASDVFYRFKKMQGYNVLHPQGFDSFGLPAENYAIKTGVKPAETTQKNILNYIEQMKSLGFDYDFDEKVITSDPGYYKWTQWIFGKFFENGLVYKKTQKTNWCSSCQTVIANEQVVDAKCERCGTEIVQKEVPGWFFKITDFSDELIADLATVDWPEYTKKNQINWIGKSQGALLKFQIKGLENSIEVFTTRPDTLFGATYVVLAPEHKLVNELKDRISNWDVIEKYIIQTQNKTELDRMEAKEKTGEKLEGVVVVNPANGQELPIFIADYVLAGYGTGAIMAVPAHDERDFEFAKKYDLPIVEVISGGDVDEKAYIENGELVNSGKFDGMSVEKAKQEITQVVGGEMTATYRLRDWSFSRQRYWGCPIPIVYSPAGEAHLIPEKHLPWKLPEDVDFVPTGVAPLSKSEELKKRVEDIFGQGWTAEYDTMDTFVDSSWYFLRYPDPHNEESFCGKDRLKKWMPVDLYIGGAEHTYMHLLYARFFTKAMHKIGLIDFDEPFLKLRHQGMVLDKEGKKMSKSKGNVINPDSMVEKFGADAVRTYMLFAAPLEDEVMWNEDNIVGVRRFLDKVWSSFQMYYFGGGILEAENNDKQLHIIINKTIKKVTNDIENLRFNTAISELMTALNSVKSLVLKNTISDDARMSFIKKYLIILSPFAPHITEELWEMTGHKESIFLQSWPEVDEKYLQDDEIEMVVQVNGRVRERLMVACDVTEDEIKETALENAKVKVFTEGKEIKKIIFVPGKLINIVVQL
ncbi:MAG: leucine--tRNA ligase [Candidatus Moranbacteria bacterium]|nr:leucine--tRNA ligase [Candidatus Moranbacteria bacterium]